MIELKFCWKWCLNPFPHIEAFWPLCSRQVFENIVTKEEIAQNEQFLLLPQCFPLLVIGYSFNYRDFLFFDKICSKSSAAELSYDHILSGIRPLCFVLRQYFHLLTLYRLYLYESLSEHSSPSNLGRVWNWAIWGQKLGH